MEFLFLEQTIKADKSINAIKPGMAQKTILYGNSILFIQPSIKMLPELGEYLHSLPLMQQDSGAFWLFCLSCSLAVQSWNPEIYKKNCKLITIPNGQCENLRNFDFEKFLLFFYAFVEYLYKTITTQKDAD